MAKDYKINEGNMIGAMPAEFDANTNLQQKVLKASADIKKGQVVIISGDMTVAPSTEASASVLGVAMFDAKEGDPVSVETEGLFRLTASGAITAGAQVESAADGKVATKDDTVTKVIGIALNTASNGGEVFVKFSI
jgi:predicted RecA/RadA family phage recombinase